MKGRPDFEWTTSVKAKEVTFGKLSDERKVTYVEEPDAETEVKVDWAVVQRIVHRAEDEDFEAEDVAREVEERRRREAEGEAAE